MERKSGSIRHSFEHQMLRDYYMKNPTDFVDTMGRDGTLFRVYDSVCREHGEENSYRPEQYSADLLTAPDGTKADDADAAGIPGMLPYLCVLR